MLNINDFFEEAKAEETMIEEINNEAEDKSHSNTMETTQAVNLKENRQKRNERARTSSDPAKIIKSLPTDNSNNEDVASNHSS